MKILGAMFLLFLFPVGAVCNVLHVPGDYAKIQDAIDAAANGDTVLVAAGTYMECIDFEGKAIVVISEDGPGSTTIDGHHLKCVVTFKNNEGPDSRLEGFTVYNGAGHSHAGSAAWGAGIYCYLASPTIHGNIIYDNFCSGYGGGICLRESDAVISENEITENYTKHTSVTDPRGSGIYSLNGSPTITGNTITHNELNNQDTICSAHGAGIYCGGSGSPIIDGNIISHNTNICGSWADIVSRAYGGGISCFCPNARITNNMITDNSVESGCDDEAYAYGGGIHCEGCDVIIRNNTILNNSVQAPNGLNKFKAMGGGVFILEGSAEVQDNIVQGNTSIFGGGMGFEELENLVIHGNTYFENSAEGGAGGGIWGDDNVSAVISENYILNNEAMRDGYIDGDGGGIYYHTDGGNTSLELLNNIIAMNTAYQSAGMDVLVSGGTGLVSNNTITHNSAIWVTGGAYLHASGGLILVNTTIWGNDCPYSQELFPTVTEATYCNIRGGWPGTGNIDVDPLFVDPANMDFRVKVGSPCIDSGDKTVFGLPETDIEGDYRIADGDMDGVSEIDIGADEFLTLRGSGYTLSTLHGGTIDLDMDMGAANGNRRYVILGGMSGTSPGMALPGGHVTLPMNWDLYTDIVWANLNTAYFHNFLNYLDPSGTTEAQLWFDRLHPLLLGETMTYAATCNSPFNVVTNFIQVDIVE